MKNSSNRKNHSFYWLVWWWWGPWCGSIYCDSSCFDGYCGWPGCFSQWLGHFDFSAPRHVCPLFFPGSWLGGSIGSGKTLGPGPLGHDSWLPASDCRCSRALSWNHPNRYFSGHYQCPPAQSGLRAFPLKVGLYTTVYITMMGLAGTVGSMVAVPIVEASSGGPLLSYWPSLLA